MLFTCNSSDECKDSFSKVLTPIESQDTSPSKIKLHHHPTINIFGEGLPQLHVKHILLRDKNQTTSTLKDTGSAIHQVVHILQVKNEETSNSKGWKNEISRCSWRILNLTNFEMGCQVRKRLL